MSNSSIMYITSNIRFLRKRRNRTQDEVALALKMKRSTLSGYENEVALPGIDALISFSKYYNVAIDTLVKIDLIKLSEHQISEIERGNDIFILVSVTFPFQTEEIPDVSNHRRLYAANSRRIVGYR